MQNPKQAKAVYPVDTSSPKWYNNPIKLRCSTEDTMTTSKVISQLQTSFEPNPVSCLWSCVKSWLHPPLCHFLRCGTKLTNSLDPNNFSISELAWFRPLTWRLIYTPWQICLIIIAAMCTQWVISWFNLGQ